MTMRKTGRARGRSTKVPIVGVVLGVIALAFVAAVVFGGGGGPSDFTAGEPVIEGPALPSAGDATDLAIGMIAPVVEGTGFNSEPVVIQHEGTAKGIVFLAHWCPHCRAEVPRVQEWLDGGGTVEGAEIISVATANEETQVNYPPSDWLIGEGWTSPVIVDSVDSSVFQAYGAGGFPYWVFLDADGVVVRRTQGELSTDALVSLLREAAGL